MAGVDRRGRRGAVSPRRSGEDSRRSVLQRNPLETLSVPRRACPRRTTRWWPGFLEPLPTVGWPLLLLCSLRRPHVRAATNRAGAPSRSSDPGALFCARRSATGPVRSRCCRPRGFSTFARRLRISDCSSSRSGRTRPSVQFRGSCCGIAKNDAHPRTRSRYPSPGQSRRNSRFTRVREVLKGGRGRTVRLAAAPCTWSRRQEEDIGGRKEQGRRDGLCQSRKKPRHMSPTSPIRDARRGGSPSRRSPLEPWRARPCIPRRLDGPGRALHSWSDGPARTTPRLRRACFASFLEARAAAVAQRPSIASSHDSSDLPARAGVPASLSKPLESKRERSGGGLRRLCERESRARGRIKRG